MSGPRAKDFPPAVRSSAARLRIGIDLGLCTAAYGGIGRYVEELTRALLSRSMDEHNQNEFVLFAGDKKPAWLLEMLASASADQVAGRALLDTRCTGPWHSTVRGNVFLGPQLSRLGIGVFHAPDTLGFPLTASRRIGRVVTIHDLIPLLFPETLTRGHRWIRCAVLPAVVRRADLLIADSQATARDVMERFPDAREKTRVVHLGVDARFAPVPADVVANVRRQLGLPSEYLLYAGVINPIKNLERLIEAHAIVRAETREIPPLVIAGRSGWLVDGIMRRARELGLGGHVRFCGFVPDGALPALITGASAFLFPSLYEGFGLPILEAMACGTPVVTSDCSSMPEVAANAAVLVDPARPDAIADGIRRVLADDALRATLKGRGAARARAFPWAATAARTLDAYREAAGAVV
ncbi:MAG TPA: glycosyltransferase family 1 protein [bacterium]|nr:glycosyltransferase family 1 protein [bacterium]